MSEARRAQKPVGSEAPDPLPLPFEAAGGVSDGISVSQKTARVRRCSGLKTSLSASAAIISPTVAETSPE